jgi:hypothetical protein
LETNVDVDPVGFDFRPEFGVASPKHTKGEDDLPAVCAWSRRLNVGLVRYMCTRA